MKIIVAKVPPEGTTQEAWYDPPALEMETALVRFNGRLHGVAQIRKSNHDLFVSVAMDATWRLECVRCLRWYEQPFVKELQLHYKVQLGDTVDITNELREETMIEYPWKPLCGPSCQGLCRTCGQNWNEGPCVHA